MRLKTIALLSSTLFTLAVPYAAMAAPDGVVPVAALVRAVDIPFTTFTLANGLRVIVHTDRSVKVVALNVTYDVGSKHEPAGRTGFAHLFEHLMFAGSENVSGDFLSQLSVLGVTANNGMTQDDKTVYYETVPTPALERTLFLESDRMGHLLGTLTQRMLDEQRGVVKNEKRQGDNQPGGLVSYKLTEALFAPEHPYGHSVIGSMADLDAASLVDVKTWFRQHYGPNNAVLTLAGDIDEATARVLVERYFGDIPAGPRNPVPVAPIPERAARVDDTLTDGVSATALYRAWAVPGAADPGSLALDAAAGTMATIGASPLELALVRRDKLFTWIAASNNSMTQGGIFIVQGEVAPGVDPVVAGRRLDAEIAKFLRDGPTADDLQRYVTSSVANGLKDLGSVSGKAFALSEGPSIGRAPDYYRTRLVALAEQTPASVRTSAAAWLGRPVYALTLAPGSRVGYVDSTAVEPAASAPAPAAPSPAVPSARTMPALGTFADLAFPVVERRHLRNGIELVYAGVAGTPTTYVTVDFDAGTAADRADRLGTQELMLALLDEGTATRDAVELSRSRERLGAELSGGATGDRTRVSLSIPSGNLGGGVDLLADVIRNPAFAAEAIERRRTAQQAQIAGEMADPGALANRIRLPMLDAASPYAKGIGAGDATAVAALTRADLVAFHHAWLRPDKARIFIVSGRPIAEVQATLERGFGDWRGAGAPGVKQFAGTPRPASPQIVLVDRPDSAQSVILAGQYTPLRGTDDTLALSVANDALGGGFLSRLNTDLRERKHWSYGVNSNFRTLAHTVTYGITASVQVDKTGPSIATMRDIVGGFVKGNPMTEAEFRLAIDSRIRALPGRFATADAIMAALRENDLYRRPDDYYTTITSRYRAMTLDETRRAATAFDPARMIWVVVGNAGKVKPQLDDLGLPVTVVPEAGHAADKKES